MTDPKLDAHRQQAALESCGTSSQAIHDAILAVAGRNPKRAKALDFGAGTGELARALVARGIFDEVHAVDLLPFEGAHLSGIQWHYADLNEPIPESPESFDAILAAEVIEHLENPRALAREWYRLVKPGCYVVCSTPNNESYRSLLSLFSRGYHVAFGPTNYPAHIMPMLGVDLRRVLQEAGFVDIQLSYTNRGSLPKLTRITWQQLSLGLLRGRRFSDNVVAFGRKPAKPGSE